MGVLPERSFRTSGCSDEGGSDEGDDASVLGLKAAIQMLASDQRHLLSLFYQGDFIRRCNIGWTSTEMPSFES